MKAFLAGVAISVPLLVLLALGFQRNPNASASPLLGRKAPTFSLSSLDDRTVSLRKLRGGPVVVNFWASWCTSCKVEHERLLALWRSTRGHVTFLGIEYQDTDAAARAFIKNRGTEWPTLRDPGETTALNFGVSGVPETFVIDSRGVVRYKWTGPVKLVTLARQLKTLGA